MVVDEATGRIDGVGLGDSAAEIRRQVGGGSTEGGRIRAFPDDLGFTDAVRYPPGDPFGDRVRTLRFNDRTFLITRPSGAFAVFLWNPEARTRRGVAIGDRLESVRKRYSRVRCGEAVVDDGDTFPTCAARVGARTIVFAKDPIRSFTLG